VNGEMDGSASDVNPPQEDIGYLQGLYPDGMRVGVNQGDLLLKAGGAGRIKTESVFDLNGKGIYSNNSILWDVLRANGYVKALTFQNPVQSYGSIVGIWHGRVSISNSGGTIDSVTSYFNNTYISYVSGVGDAASNTISLTFSYSDSLGWIGNNAVNGAGERAMIVPHITYNASNTGTCDIGSVDTTNNRFVFRIRDLTYGGDGLGTVDILILTYRTYVG